MSDINIKVIESIQKTGVVPKDIPMTQVVQAP